MKAYSQDLRERVLRAVDQGYQRAEIIKLFGVSRATIKRYLKQRRETGEVNVKPIPGRPPKKFAPCFAPIRVFGFYTAKQNRLRSQLPGGVCGGDGGESNSPSKRTHRRIYYRRSRCFS